VPANESVMADGLTTLCQAVPTGVRTGSRANVIGFDGNSAQTAKAFGATGHAIHVPGQYPQGKLQLHSKALSVLSAEPQRLSLP